LAKRFIEFNLTEKQFELLRPIFKKILLLLLIHTPRAYDSARALWLCGPSTHCSLTRYGKLTGQSMASLYTIYKRIRDVKFKHFICIILDFSYGTSYLPLIHEMKKAKFALPTVQQLYLHWASQGKVGLLRKLVSKAN
jgi:hypothetical protein